MCADDHKSAVGSLGTRMKQKRSAKMEVFRWQKEGPESNPRLAKRMRLGLQKVQRGISVPIVARK